MSEQPTDASLPQANRVAGADSVPPRGEVPAHDLARLMDVRVEVSVELGRRRMSIAEVLHIAPSAIVEFFKKADDPLDIRVNGRLVARGEPVVMGDRYGVRITEVLSSQQAGGRIDVEDINT